MTVPVPWQHQQWPNRASTDKSTFIEIRHGGYTVLNHQATTCFTQCHFILQNFIVITLNAVVVVVDVFVFVVAKLYFCISLTWFRIFEKKSNFCFCCWFFFCHLSRFVFCVELHKHFTHWFFFNVAIWNHFFWKKRKNDQANEFILMAIAKESSQNKHRNEWTTICTATGCNDGKNKKWRNWRCTLVDHQQKKYYKNHLITTRFIFSSFISL